MPIPIIQVHIIGTDLTFEGIATWAVKVDSSIFRYDRNRPDIRRDCDLEHLFHCLFLPFYRNRPDIRRDCDRVFRNDFNHLATPYRNRPDIRRDCDARLRPLIRIWLLTIGTDLTFEGIATRCVCTLTSFDPNIGTDLTFEGIATVLRRLVACALFMDIGTDLTFEGIATCDTLEFHFAYYLNRNRPDIRRDCDALPH